jgi:DNA-binding PadR family transcriptional regulator
VQIAGRHRDNPHVVYFTLSAAGRRKLDEGRAWWNRLSGWQRLKVRLLG